MHAASGMQKHVMPVTKYTPTTSLLAADLLQRKMSFPGTSDFELVDHTQVPQQVVPPKPGEKLSSLSREDL